MLKKMQVIIVEDHLEARNELKYLLSLHPDVEVFGDFEDTASAWPVIEAGNIDGVFLDIEIFSEGSEAGLNLARRIDRLPEFKPWVVFTTGFKKYAPAACKVRPFGYLVKAEMDDNEVKLVLDRIREEYPKKPNNPELAEIEVTHKVVDHEKNINCTKYLAQKDIVYIQSNNIDNTSKIEMLNKTKAQLVNGDSIDGIIDKTLRQWLNETSQSWLDEKGDPIIMQIHKSHLVNLNQVNGYKPDLSREDGRYLVTFRNCKHELPIGRKFFNALRNALKKRGAISD